MREAIVLERVAIHKIYWIIKSVTCFHYKDSMANIVLYELDHSFNNDSNEDDVLKTLVCSSNSINIESLYPPLNSSFAKQKFAFQAQRFL